MKVGRAAFLALALLVLSVLPAAAASAQLGPTGAAVVLAAAKPWHYWISFVLAASFLGLIGLLALGYVTQVVLGKYGIRLGKRPTE